jgi:ankyrin repeat protein
VKALLDTGAEVNVTYERGWGEGSAGWTPLMEAAESGSLEIVRTLKALGVGRFYV